MLSRRDENGGVDPLFGEEDVRFSNVAATFATAFVHRVRSLESVVARMRDRAQRSFVQFDRGRKFTVLELLQSVPPAEPHIISSRTSSTLYALEYRVRT